MAGSASSVAALYKGLLASDRSALAKAITLAESTLAADRKTCEQLLKKLLPVTGKSIRIGITGVPGVGKSTFIEAFGTLLTQKGKKIGILTVDPSSRKTKGSILGDKTRMPKLSRNDDVFIRPSPSGLALGGVSHHTRESILFCEAAGYDVIIVETVGVGQSETEVRSMVDFFLLLVLPGAGDELQGIKKGIMEMADGVVITKADGENLRKAKQALADATAALHMQQARDSGWKTQVLATSALEGTGLEEVWKMILGYHQHAEASGYFLENRRIQKMQWLAESVESHIRSLAQGKGIAREKEKISGLVANDKLLPTEAARQLWQKKIKVKGKRK